LIERVTKLRVDNKKLRKKQEALEHQNEEIQAEVAEMPEVKISPILKSASEIFEVELMQPLEDQLRKYKLLYEQQVEDLAKEERRTKLVEREVYYMQKYMKKLDKKAKKQCPKGKCKEKKPAEMVELEIKMNEIREKMVMFSIVVKIIIIF